MHGARRLRYLVLSRRAERVQRRVAVCSAAGQTSVCCVTTTVVALLRARSNWSGKTNVCHFRHPRIMARKPLKVSTGEMCNTGDPPLVCARTLIHVSTTLYTEHSTSQGAHTEQSGCTAGRACRGRPGHRCAQSAKGQASVLGVTSSFCSSFRANQHWSAQAAECHKRDRSDSGLVRPNAKLSRCFGRHRQ